MFFTRLPLPDRLSSAIDPEKRLSDAVIMFPVAGIVIGSTIALAWTVANTLLPPLPSAALAIVAGLLITGALHEDGLADCADGLGATSDRQRALEIMRDSTVGSYGALALTSSFILRVFALASLTVLSGAVALLIAHTVSRSAISLAMRFSVYARPEGLGRSASGEMEDRDFFTCIAIAAAIAIVLGWIAGVLAAICGFGIAWIFLSYLNHRIGGYTGDGLGAMQQLSEILVLLVLAGAWS